MKKSKAHTIMEQIDELKKELLEYQSKCKHKKVEKTHKGNTGNYDPTSDSYWTEFHCPTCLKRWTEDQ